MALLQRIHSGTMRSRIYWAFLLFLWEALLTISSVQFSASLPSLLLTSINSRFRTVPLNVPATMDNVQVQQWMHAIRPISGTSDSFEDVPLSPLNDEDQSSHASEGFFHMPLEHELVASPSVWDGSAISDELGDLQSIAFTKFSEQGSPGAAGSIPSEDSLIGVDDRAPPARILSETLREPEQKELRPASSVRDFRSDSALTSGPFAPSIASTVTLVEKPLTLNKISESSVEIFKFPFSTESPKDRNLDPSIPESDISDESSNFSDYINQPTGPADLTTSTPPAKVLSQTPFSRAKRPNLSPPSPIPGIFEIPIPIFPFAAGTTRCTNRKCPIKYRHEQGPYLHEGKLRSREGSMFGSSNPPPEIWSLYDMWREENLQGMGNQVFAPVELFAKFHFGETMEEHVCGMEVAGGSGRQVVERGGKMVRFLRLWG